MPRRVPDAQELPPNRANSTLRPGPNRANRGRRTPDDVRVAILRLAGLNYSASEIRDKLSREKQLRARVPESLRTIQHIARRARRGDDESGTWRLADATGDEGALILPVLAAAWEESGGRITFLTRAEADWIVRLRRASVELRAWDYLAVARHYIARLRDGESTDELDLILASKQARRAWMGRALDDLRAVLEQATKDRPEDPPEWVPHKKGDSR
jgi:hypothetical protein